MINLIILPSDPETQIPIDRLFASIDANIKKADQVLEDKLNGFKRRLKNQELYLKYSDDQESVFWETVYKSLFRFI